jgi:hypothetical protein
LNPWKAAKTEPTYLNSEHYEPLRESGLVNSTPVLLEASPPPSSGVFLDSDSGGFALGYKMAIGFCFP